MQTQRLNNLDGKALEAEVRESHIRNSNPNGKEFVKNWNSCLDAVSQTFEKLNEIQKIRNEEREKVRVFLVKQGIKLSEEDLRFQWRGFSLSNDSDFLLATEQNLSAFMEWRNKYAKNYNR